MPATDYEALKSSLMGLFEKRRARSFFMCARRCLQRHCLQPSSNVAQQHCSPAAVQSVSRQLPGRYGRDLQCLAGGHPWKLTVQQSLLLLLHRSVQSCIVWCSYVQNYVPEDPRTHAGRNLNTMSMAALYKEFGLDPQTVDFIG